MLIEYKRQRTASDTFCVWVIVIAVAMFMFAAVTLFVMLAPVFFESLPSFDEWVSFAKAVMRNIAAL